MITPPDKSFRLWASPADLHFTLAMLGKRPLWSPSLGSQDAVARYFVFEKNRISLTELNVSTAGARLELVVASESTFVAFPFGMSGLRASSTVLARPEIATARQQVRSLVEKTFPGGYTAFTGAFLEVCAADRYCALADQEATGTPLVQYLETETSRYLG